MTEMTEQKIKTNKSVVLFFAISIAAVAFDQYTKYATQNFMNSRGGEELVIIPGFVSIVHTFNTGVAFGMFQGAQPYSIYIPVVLVMAMIVILFKYSGNDLPAMAGVSLMLGGALGNLIDRLHAGKVFDFIDVYVGTMHWPTFNAADSFIVIGTFLFAFFFILRGEKDE